NFPVARAVQRFAVDRAGNVYLAGSAESRGWATFVGDEAMTLGVAAECNTRVAQRAKTLFVTKSSRAVLLECERTRRGCGSGERRRRPIRSGEHLSRPI